jgi:hypothetical protein
VLIVAKILGHRERGVTHAEAAAGGLVHLAKDHRHVGQHPGCFHLAVKFLALAATFPDAAKDTHALVVADHVVNHLREQDGLPHSGTAEESSLATTL